MESVRRGEIRDNLRVLEGADRDNGYTPEARGVGNGAEARNFDVRRSDTQSEEFAPGSVSHMDREGNVLIDAPGQEGEFLAQERLREDREDLKVEEWSKGARYANVKNTETGVVKGDQLQNGGLGSATAELGWEHNLLVKNQEKLTNEAVKNIAETIRKNKSLRELDASRTKLMHGILGGYGRKLGDRN